MGDIEIVNASPFDIGQVACQLRLVERRVKDLIHVFRDAFLLGRRNGAVETRDEHDDKFEGHRTRT